MNTEDMIKWHKRRYETLIRNRANFDAMFQEIAERTYPAHANFQYTPTEGEKRMQKVYDSTAIHANELLSSGLFSLLTSTASRWFQIMPVNYNLYSIPAVKLVLDERSRIMYHEINRPSAGFATAMHEGYLSYGAFGNQVQYVDEIPEKESLMFQCLPLYECFFVQNQYNIVDTLYRKYARTVEQLVRKFGIDQVSPKVRELAGQNKLDKVISCTHVIMPRETRDILNLNSVNKPFASLYIDLKHEHIMHEGGYDELPFMAARFYKESFETYGRGPGATTLPDNKMLQRVAQVTIRSAQKTTDPPIIMPDSGFLRPLRTTPGGMNYYRRGRFNLKNDIDVLPTGQPGFGLEFMESLHKRIREAFFVDQLQLNEGPQMTATEVLQRTEEKLRLMGPLLGRIQMELLGPMIIRVHNLLERAGKFPPIPPELEEQDVKIVYTSPIARAQEQVEANGLMRSFDILRPLIEMNDQNNILDKFNTDKMAEGVFDMFSVNPNFLNDAKEVRRIREQRRQAEEKRQQAENLRAAGQGAASLAQGAATAQEAGMMPEGGGGFGMLQ